MIILIAVCCSLYLLIGLLWYTVGVTLILVISIYVILYSVYRIKKLIRVIENAFPNERLMTLHFVNFTTYAVFRIAKLFLKLLAQKLEQSPHALLGLKLYYAYFIVGLVENTIYLYANIFLLYLLLKFTSPHHDFRMKDTVLDKEVPNIVFLMNQQLVR